MGSFDWNSEVVFDTNIARLYDGFGDNYKFKPLGTPPSASLVLDSQRGELVRAPAKIGQKGKSEAKAITSLKNHSEAERRRRERINSHLNTLRSLVPCTEKMDKASLLAEVISHVKELKRSTAEACNGLVIPMDVDQVIVEPHEDGADELFCIKATLCCEDRPEIFTDLRQALDTFNLKTVNVDIATLGGRMKNIFVLAGFNVDNTDDPEVRRLITNSVHQALTSILDKYSGPSELSPIVSHSHKRRKFSLFDSSSSSS